MNKKLFNDKKIMIIMIMIIIISIIFIMIVMMIIEIIMIRRKRRMLLIMIIKIIIVILIIMIIQGSTLTKKFISHAGLVTSTFTSPEILLLALKIDDIRFFPTLIDKICQSVTYPQPP